jgi:hypothetical protein
VGLSGVSVQRQKSKLTPAVHKTLVKAAREGLPKNRTCHLVGIDTSTLWHWIDRGEQGIEPYAALVRDLERAETEFEQEMVSLVAEAARADPRNWTAAMTILERKHPERYGRRDVHVVEGNPERPIITHQVLHDPEARAAATTLLNRVAELQEAETVEGEAEEVEFESLGP